MDFFLSQEGEAPACCYLVQLQHEFEPKLKGLNNKIYGSELTEIAIISILVSEKYLDSHKERVLFQKKQRGADVRLRIDYKTFVRAKPEQRRQIYMEHIIQAIESLRSRVKRANKDYQFDELVRDVKSALQF